ncbi:MAG: hypothetical protein KGL18_15135 [Burkholderiales bacterium]|nr:hypothetical protein [Burkholderiales bacterium]MDE1929868.1 hypothetical protein [Burkholderiales bacterium]MDE2504297.1 hypothetical protein [Burkholderiales bacterium]
MNIKTHRIAAIATLAACALGGGTPALAAPGAAPEPPPASTPNHDRDHNRTASLPAQGLFAGDQLTAATRSRIDALIAEAQDMRIEVVLVVPTGPWTIDGGTHKDNDLTRARLANVRRYLAGHGLDPRRIFVERRTDKRVREPHLEVQLVGEMHQD